jgi:hypothetical protein
MQQSTNRNHLSISCTLKKYKKVIAIKQSLIIRAAQGTLQQFILFECTMLSQ